MPLLRPWIRKKDEDPAEGCRRQPLEYGPSVVRTKADRREAVLIDSGQCLDHALLEGLTPDYADLGMVLGLPDEVLGASEPDLEPDLFHGRSKKRRRFRRRCRCRVQRQARQKIGPQLLLARTELAPSP